MVRVSVGMALAILVPNMSALAAAAEGVTAATPRPDAVGIGSADSIGPLFTTADGMTLYVTDLDPKGGAVFGCRDVHHLKSGGDDAYPLPRAQFRPTCVDRWKPLVAAPSASPVGAWSIVSRPEGTRQWAYEGQPVYRSTRDHRPGDDNGTMGLPHYGAWRLLAAPRDLPPGTRLVRKLDGLMLASAEDDRLLFMLEPKQTADERGLDPLVAPALAPASRTVARRDGLRQWTFRGRPIFRARGDMSNAAIQAQVASRRWQPIIFQAARPRPAFVTLHMSVPEIGWVYGDARGRTLYAFYCFDQTPDRLHCDEPGDPAAHRSALCGTAAQCAHEWRPVPAAPLDRPVGNWGIDDVPDPPFETPTGAYGQNTPTVRAWTYHGRPVYTFSGDRVPGDVLGHGIDARVSGFGALTVLKDEFPVMP